MDLVSHTPTSGCMTSADSTASPAVVIDETEPFWVTFLDTANNSRLVVDCDRSDNLEDVVKRVRRTWNHLPSDDFMVQLEIFRNSKQMRTDQTLAQNGVFDGDTLRLVLRSRYG